MPGHTRDYYKVLQVDPAADPEVIAAAYRRLSLKYHPDTNPAADATRRMQEINEAYEVLKDPARRADYDLARRTGAAGYGPEEAGRRAQGPAPAAARHAPDPVQPGFHAFRNVPRGAKTVKAFAAEPVYCHNNPPQEHVLPGGCWIDLGFEWVARELVTVTTTWPALNIAVTVDGVPVSRSQWEVKGPDAIALPSAQGPRYGYVVADALYLPALPPGDHVVRWTVTFARNVDDGWAPTRAGRSWWSPASCTSAKTTAHAFHNLWSALPLGDTIYGESGRRYYSVDLSERFVLEVLLPTRGPAWLT